MSSAALVEEAPAESRRLAVRVGKVTQRNLAPDPNEVLRHEFDVALVRAETHADVTWLQDVLERYLVVKTHDLLYFRLDRRTPFSVPAVELDLAGALAGIAETFADYRNHWTNDPLIPSFRLVEAYLEWTEALLDAGAVALAVSTPEERHAGVAILSPVPSGYDVALAGVQPMFRGKGVYRSLTRAWADWAWAQGASSVTISTESWNTQVIGTWRSERYVAAERFATYHLVRRAMLPWIHP